MNNISIIIEAFENRIGQVVCSINKFENVPNNQVYQINTKDKAYIFKIYDQRDWPEDGKLHFIDKKLDECNIAHAKLYDFNRDNEHFPNGYLIEEFLEGKTADKLNLSFEENIRLYRKLAAIVSKVHKISMINYGFIGGNGVADWRSFSEYIYDMFDDTTSNLRNNKILDLNELNSIKERLREKLKACDCYPSVLCHGDLSTDNLMVYENDITIIDWDDAQALCWMADIARMTFWMKLKYDSKSALS